LDHFLFDLSGLYWFEKNYLGDRPVNFLKARLKVALELNSRIINKTANTMPCKMAIKQMILRGLRKPIGKKNPVLQW
jgi:hypothetical protein